MSALCSRTFQLSLGLAFILSATRLAADDKELPGNLRKGSEIIGQKVVNDQGQKLGDIEEIVIDPATGTIAYAVISSGGFLGIGDKFVAVPWQSFRAQPGKKDELVLNVDKERMKNAPGFDKNHWPDLNPQWANQVNEFYGVQPAGEMLVVVLTGFDFGEASVKREGLMLPLKFEQDKSYHYVMEMQPYPPKRAGFSSPQGEGDSTGNQAMPMVCKHDGWLKVAKGSGDDATLSFTLDATNCEFCKQAAKEAGREPPGKGTYTIKTNQRGEVTSFQPEAGGASNQQQTAMEGIARLQVRQLLGEGLHNQRLEPGKTYDVAWMHPDEWHKAKAASQAGKTLGVAPAASTAGRETDRPSILQGFLLRYDGYTQTAGERVALFTVVPSGGTPSTGNENRPAADREDRNFGHANFRTEDGFLERFGMVIPASLRKSQEKPDQKGPAMEGPIQFTVKRVD